MRSMASASAFAIVASMGTCMARPPNDPLLAANTLSSAMVYPEDVSFDLELRLSDPVWAQATVTVTGSAEVAIDWKDGRRETRKLHRGTATVVWEHRYFRPGFFAPSLSLRTSEASQVVEMESVGVGIEYHDYNPVSLALLPVSPGNAEPSSLVAKFGGKFLGSFDLTLWMDGRFVGCIEPSGNSFAPAPFCRYGALDELVHPQSPTHLVTWPPAHWKATGTRRAVEARIRHLDSFQKQSIATLRFETTYEPSEPVPSTTAEGWLSPRDPR